MNSFKRFNEDKLCARKYFYSSTKDKKISEDGKISDGHVSIEDYMVCERIWDKFKMKNMGYYHDLYLKKDVLLLADVFEKFISTCLKYYELDPCHYFSAPGLSWDAMLKMTGVKLEKYLTLTSICSLKKGEGEKFLTLQRYDKANNKYMCDYDSNKQSTFITYLDKNNLYGWAMSEYLPYGEFEWLKNFDELDVMSIIKKSDAGYILEVYLEYPKELHDLHNCCPLATQKLTITNDILSKYCKEIADEYGIKVGDVKKLIPNLGNKTKYVVHYRDLKLYLSLGMKLTKIHRVLQFKESDLMNKYIDFNTKKRMSATNIYLEYPKELHDLHNCCPLATQKLTVTNDILSKYCKEIADEYDIKVGDVKKLIPNLGNKTKYVAHCRNLQLYLSLGMKLTKIHRVLQFKQSDWMNKYIDFNTKRRMSATNDFEKRFF